MEKPPTNSIHFCHHTVGCVPRTGSAPKYLPHHSPPHKSNIMKKRGSWKSPHKFNPFLPSYRRVRTTHRQRPISPQHHFLPLPKEQHCLPPPPNAIPLMKRFVQLLMEPTNAKLPPHENQRRLILLHIENPSPSNLSMHPTAT